jgi:hypothetical protein
MDWSRGKGEKGLFLGLFLPEVSKRRNRETDENGYS